MHTTKPWSSSDNMRALLFLKKPNIKLFNLDMIIVVSRNIGRKKYAHKGKGHGAHKK